MTLYHRPVSAARLGEVVDRFNQASEIGSELFIAAYDRYGSRARVSAVLEVCGKPQMAKSLKVTPETVREDAARDFMRACKGRKYCDEQQRWAVMGSVQSMWNGYLLGYREAAKTLMTADRDALCADVVKKANAILEEKSKEKGEK